MIITKYGTTQDGIEYSGMGAWNMCRYCWIYFNLYLRLKEGKMVVGFVVAGALAAFFCFLMWCCCKAASDSGDKTNRDDLD